MDPLWMVSQIHGQLVDVRASYDGFMTGHNGQEELFSSLGRLENMMEHLREHIEENVCRELDEHQKRKHGNLRKHVMTQGRVWPLNRNRILKG